MDNYLSFFNFKICKFICFLLFLLSFQKLIKASEIEDVITNSIGMEFKKIRPGKFFMGRKEPSITVFERFFGRHKFYDWEHEAVLTKGFYISVYEFTEENLKAIKCDEHKQAYGRFSSPFDNKKSAVCFFNPTLVCKVIDSLNDKEKKLGRVYRLPTEAEWEYSCRAGTRSRYFWGDDETLLPEYAWFNLNKHKNPKCCVGLLKPNSWGLYDMLGNVEEWTSDTFKEFPKISTIYQPKIFSDQGKFVVGNVCRGGRFDYSSDSCECSYRHEAPWEIDGNQPSYSAQGLRLVIEEKLP